MILSFYLFDAGELATERLSKLVRLVLGFLITGVNGDHGFLMVQKLIEEIEAPSVCEIRQINCNSLDTLGQWCSQREFFTRTQ